MGKPDGSHTAGRECSPSSEERLLTVEDLAVALRVPVSWVYRHADDLGAFRLGKYLRFRLAEVFRKLQPALDGSPSVKPSTLRPKLNSNISLTSDEHGTIREQKSP
jgi:hypothetical protein